MSVETNGKDSTARLADALDHQGRFSERKYFELADLCRHSMKKMEAVGKRGTDNYLFFQDLYFALMNAIDITRVNNAVIGERHVDKTVIKIYSERCAALEEELSGYRVIDRLKQAGSLQMWMDNAQEAHQKLQDLLAKKYAREENSANPRQ